MTTINTTTTSDEELVEHMWRLTLRAMVTRLEKNSEEMTAAELTACGRFLAAQGISLASLKAADAGPLQELGPSLPFFEDEL